MANLKEYQTTKEAFDNATMFSKELTECDRWSIEYLKTIAQGKVLEIGCGMGNVIEKLNCERYAIDLSPKMIEHCQIENKQVANMDELPFPDNTFDLVYMVMTLQHSLNPEKTLDEAERVLKEGRPLIVIDGDKESSIGQQRENDPNWEKCGDAKWFTEQYFIDMGFEVDHLAPHILIARIFKDDWTIEHEAMKIITDYIKENKPNLVVELGSGKSSYRLGKLCNGSFISFENKNNQELTPFTKYSSKGKWYDIKDFPAEIDLLIIDGPAAVFKNARKPAERLFPRTKAAFLHDTIREDEKNMFASWKGKKTKFNTKHGLCLIEL